MAALVFALLGGIVGGALLSDFGGAVLGAAVGALVGWVSELAGRVRQLERRLEARKTAEAHAAAVPPRPSEHVAEPQGGDRFINPFPSTVSERAADGLKNQSPPDPRSGRIKKSVPAQPRTAAAR